MKPKYKNFRTDFEFGVSKFASLRKIAVRIPTLYGNFVFLDRGIFEAEIPERMNKKSLAGNSQFR